MTVTSKGSKYGAKYGSGTLRYVYMFPYGCTSDNFQ